MQFLLLFLLWVWTVSMCFWVLISLFIPLMVIKVVSHLSNRFWARSLIFYRNSSKTSGGIKFDIISIENILVCVSNLYIFEPLYSLIVLAWNGSYLSRRTIILQLFIHPIPLSLFWCVNCLFIITLLFRFALRWRRRRWLGPNLHIIRWEKSF